MSYMGCIEQIMAGSVIKDSLSIIYTEGSIDKMLSEYSYARAVQAHIILQQILSQTVVDEFKQENVKFQQLLDS